MYRRIVVLGVFALFSLATPLYASQDVPPLKEHRTWGVWDASRQWDADGSSEAFSESLQALYAEGDIDGTALMLISSVDPKDPDAHYKMNIARIEACAKKGVAYAYYQLGYCALAQGQLKSALDFFNQGLSNPYARSMRAELLRCHPELDPDYTQKDYLRDLMLTAQNGVWESHIDLGTFYQDKNRILSLAHFFTAYNTLISLPRQIGLIDILDALYKFNATMSEINAAREASDLWLKENEKGLHCNADQISNCFELNPALDGAKIPAPDKTSVASLYRTKFVYSQKKDLEADLATFVADKNPDAYYFMFLLRSGLGQMYDRKDRDYYLEQATKALHPWACYETAIQLCIEGAVSHEPHAFRLAVQLLNNVETKWKASHRQLIADSQCLKAWIMEKGYDGNAPAPRTAKAIYNEYKDVSPLAWGRLAQLIDDNPVEKLAYLLFSSANETRGDYLSSTNATEALMNQSPLKIYREACERGEILGKQFPDASTNFSWDLGEALSTGSVEGE